MERVEDILKSPSNVLTALAFYASGSNQKPVGMNYLHALSQSSVSNSIKEVTQALNHPTILNKYIKFPQTCQERNVIIDGFYNEFGFPGILGAIDCTHVALIRPTICDSDLNILSVDASFGGATHDSYIWRHHPLNEHLQQLHRNQENVF
ncbi:Putative nuclease HARBI1 [Eumeta japonica]|uniref:Nuclease HARBI1 n=1 Tax=Eumeta variegata TaxID=151549 RepID=A0A4C1X9N0_EUMVA|nr:Putative nuclease HARBI1 [Eumeta japonica]